MKIKADLLLGIADTCVFSRLLAQEIAPLGAYRIERMSAIVEPEAARVQASRNRLITDANSTERGGMRQVKPECIEAFLAAITPILAEEIELAVKPLTLEDLAGAKISPQHFRALGPLVADPE